MNKEAIIDLIKDAGYGCLSTVDKNQPKVRPIAPYLDESGNLLMAILSHSRSIQQIKENPMVEICFVDRTMSFARVTGKASISDSKEKREVVWNNLPMLKQFVGSADDPNFTLVEVDTDTVEAMSPQQQKPDVLSLK